MSRRLAAPVLTAGAALSATPAYAHGFAGPHMFISTLIVDDSNVAEDASLPTLSWLRQPTAAAAALLAALARGRPLQSKLDRGRRSL